MNQNEQNPYLRAAILEAVENQLRENNPPATRATLERLKQEGHSEKEAKRLIGAVLAGEIYDVMKSGKPFNENRYTANLNRLPLLPWER